MNKLATVLGVAAVATLAGCKDPNYKPMAASSQADVKVIEPVTCQCPAGTVHSEPCSCGASDCQCVIEIKHIEKPAPAPVVEKKIEDAPKPVATPVEETTEYVVRGGDTISKISAKYNVTINSIKRLNNLKSDVIHVGQKLKLPGKLDVPPAPVATTDKGSTTKKGYTSYKGATKEYVVKTGDTLGAIAYGNGLNIRQLKELNGLTSDVLKVGQKLKIPADGKGTPVETQKINEKQSKVAPAGVIAPAPAAPVEEPAPVVEAPESVVEEPAPAEEPATSTYTVQEGDDMTGVSIRFCVSAAAIRELNNLPEDAQLTVGQVIKLPADAQQ